MGSSRRSVVVLDAYRRSNAGDGLLVDETVELVREALPGARTTLVSMEPLGFGEHPDGLHPLSGRAGTAPTFASLLRAGLLGRPNPDVERAIADADLAISVGGGYLRADSLIAGLKSYLSHVVQAPSARRSTPHIYLPQSIGPLPPRIVPFGISRLRRAQHIFVRDDRSLNELLERNVRAERMPDLAVMAMVSRGVRPRPDHMQSHPALVGRALAGRDRGYRARMHALQQTLAPELLVQSRGAGNDDPSFYESMGWGATHADLLPTLESRAPSAVASVRLHGSLQSLIAGVPSVHLSYERKGWGAYDDLNIPEYVHNAWTFDPDLVSEQIRQLATDPSDYWARVKSGLKTHRGSRQRLVDAIRESGGY